MEYEKSYSTIIFIFLQVGDNILYSSQLHNIYKRKYGYRSEDNSSGVKNLKNILKFEICELGNIDIIDFINNNYNDIAINYDEEYKDLTNITQTIYDYLKYKLNADKLYGVWLCESIEDVHRYYGESVVKVRLPDNAIPISDLGIDGSLFVYPSNLILRTIEINKEA